MRNSSIQVRLDLTGIRNGVACFGTGEQAEHCAVLEVSGSQESLGRLDDAKQEELLAAYAQFLNSLTFTFQLLVQVHPIDLSWYVTRVEERARVLSPALVAIARDHAAFVQGLSRQRTLLERRLYVVVPSSSPTDSRKAANVIPFMRLWRAWKRGGGSAHETFRAESVHRQLTDRCDAVARQLSRAGLRATRLDDLGLAQLYHVSWAPEVARTQRLRRELADYTALVVGAETPPRGLRTLERGNLRSIAGPRQARSSG